jgi:hypothetical protein
MEYIKINSYDILENFFKLYTQIKLDGKLKEKGQFPIDTVIFTGRGSQFPPLRRALKEAIKEWTTPDRNVQYIENLDGNTLKTIVVEGALIAATYLLSNNEEEELQHTPIFARYGVIYKEGEDVKFVQLLHPGSKSEIDPVGGFRKWSNSQRIDMRDSTYIYFVQSFAHNTAEEWANERKAFISVLLDFTPEEVVAASSWQDLQSIEVGIEIFEDSMGYLNLKLSAGNEVFDAFRTGIFDKSKESIFQKSMWPFPV